MIKWRCPSCDKLTKQPALVKEVGHECPKRASQKPDKRWVYFVRVEEAA